MTTTINIERHEAIETLRDLIQGMSVGMLTTLTADGRLRSRPMIPARHDFDGDVWFFTLSTAPLTFEVRSHSAVNVAYATPSKEQFVTLTGTAEIVTDQQKMELLWKDELRTWFEDGLATPNLMLLRVSVSEAEYWEKRASGAGGFLSSMMAWKGTFELVHQKVGWGEQVTLSEVPQEQRELGVER